MPDFANSKIYKLYSNNLPDTCYVGSTVRTLKWRLLQHVNDTPCASRQIIDAGDYHMDELEAYPCASKLELRKREQYWMDKHVCCNKQRAFITEEQRKEQKRVINAKHNAKNNTKNNAKRSKVPVQCFCGGKYKLQNKARHFKSKKHQSAVDIISMI